MSANGSSIALRPAEERDVSAILGFIKELAEYEKLSHEVVATEERILASLFGERPVAEALIAEYDGAPAGFALFFHSFSTFLGRPGIYLEDLYVTPDFRRRGIGKALLKSLAQLALERDCGRVEWAVLDWNEPAIGFYQGIGAAPLAEWQTYRLAGSALRTFAEN
ncbi:MAG TPA: GNAT family N-acetyltransferase [Gammaproteobacteria bacterium]